MNEQRAAVGGCGCPPGICRGQAFDPADCAVEQARAGLTPAECDPVVGHNGRTVGCCAPEPPPCICGRGREFTEGHAAFCYLPVIVERDGLVVGDMVSVNGVVLTVVGFSGHECDVVVAWSSGSRATVCRRHTDVSRVDHLSDEPTAESVYVGPARTAESEAARGNDT